MSTDLDQFRSYARRRAADEHVGACGASVGDRWGWLRWVSPDPECGGCMTDVERALWLQLADEIDAYLGIADDEKLEGL